MANYILFLAHLYLYSSICNELVYDSISNDNWTVIDGEWTYDASTASFVQTDSNTTAAELIMMDKQWYNADGLLTINYTFSLSFADYNDGEPPHSGTTGITLYNGRAAPFCEFYFVGLNFLWLALYQVVILRGTAPNQLETVRTTQYSDFEQNKDYTLSMQVHNGSTFDIFVDNVPRLSVVDNDGYDTLTDGFSGYISIYATTKVITTAKNVSISGIPQHVTTFTSSICNELVHDPILNDNWTVIDGEWTYDASTASFVQKESNTTAAELIKTDAQWHNADGLLTINYTFSLSFGDYNDSFNGNPMSGITLYNGRAAPFCEFYFVAIDFLWLTWYRVVILRGSAPNQIEKVLFDENEYYFDFEQNKDYTLSMQVRNGNAFDIFVDNVPRLSVVDNDGYATLTDGFSGYISIYATAKIITTAKHLSISGTPQHVTTFVHCVSLSPTDSPASVYPSVLPSVSPSKYPTKYPSVEPILVTGLDESDGNEDRRELWFTLIVIVGCLLLAAIVCTCTVIIILRRNKKQRQDIENAELALDYKGPQAVYVVSANDLNTQCVHSMVEMEVNHEMLTEGNSDGERYPGETQQTLK